jgi:NAD(P)-dependent dehydrogenase (short-subunit alcohol dehydrogenase family)
MSLLMSHAVLITGGTRGIGRAVAELLALRGARCVLGYRADEAAAQSAVAAVRSAGGEAVSVQVDVADESQVLRLFDTAQQHFGAIGAVVNNAGIVAPSLPLAEMSAERLRRMLDVNLYGALLVAREAARRMSKTRGGLGGAIVNVSSAASRHGSPFEYVDYAATKGAIDTLTLGLAKELARDGVRVNAVRPGLIDTEIHASGGLPDRAHVLGQSTPLGRPGTAREVAEAIVWLLSDAASYVTGAILDVAGGR